MANDLEYSLGMNTAPFQRAADQVLTSAGTLSKELTKKFELKDLGRTLATALGINLQSIAENVARWFTGVSKAEEENYAKLDTLSTQLADKQLAAMRARLTNEEAYQLLLGEQERLQQRIADNLNRTTEDQVRMKQDQLRLLDVEKESATVLAAINAESAKRADEDYRNQQKLAADLGKIKKEIADEEAKSRQAEYDFQQKLDADRLDYIDANFERLTLEAKATRGLTDEERTRLDVLRLQAQQLDVQASIRAVLSLEKRTPEEEAVLQKLIAQNVQFEKQLGAKQQIKTVTEETAEIEKKRAAAAAIAAELEMKNLKLRADFMSQMYLGGASSKDIQDSSSEAIQEKIRRNNQQLSGMWNNPGNAFEFGNSISITRLENENKRLQEELKFRRDFNMSLQFGEDNARRQFRGDPLKFDEVLSKLTGQFTAADKTAAGIEELNRRLKAGIPVINLSQPGGG